MKERHPTTIRFTDDDHEFLAKLQKLTGLEGHTAVIRLAIRESVQAREAKRRK
jgi:hypothetical protein